MAEDALAVLDAAGAASAHVYGVSLASHRSSAGPRPPRQGPVADPGVHRRLGRGCLARRTADTSPVPAARCRPQPDGMEAAVRAGHAGRPPGGRPADVRRTRCSGRGRRASSPALRASTSPAGSRRSASRRWSCTEPRTASSPPPALGDSPTASPEPGSWSSRTPVTFTSPTPPMPPTRRSCTSSPGFPVQPTAPAPAAPGNQYRGHVSGVTDPLVRIRDGAVRGTAESGSGRLGRSLRGSSVRREPDATAAAGPGMARRT